LMWYSYPDNEDWIPLHAARVREIKELNKNGEKPDDLNDSAVELAEKTPVKTFDYENVVGQDSLTRLDNRNKGRNNKNRRNNRPKNTNGAAPQQVAPGAPAPGVAPRTNNNRRRPPRRPNTNTPKPE
jgi:hypothetical protein